MASCGTPHLPDEYDMLVNFEQNKLLIVIRDDLNIEELIAFRVTYPTIYSHLKKLIDAGLVVWSDSKLRLTPSGREAILTPPERKSVRLVRDELSKTKTQPKDPEAVHLPEGELA